MARILIVDDEPDTREVLGEFLRAEGHAVVGADDADSALHQLDETEFDVVVTDILLPRITGVELLRRIQASYPHVQVVVMTGAPGVATASEALRGGALDYVCKPVTKDTIVRVVANAVRVKALNDAKRRLEAENRAFQEDLGRLVDERTRQLRHSEERARELLRFNEGVLNALTARICVLAEDGTVVAVNRAWPESAAAAPAAADLGVGGNYLAACEGVAGEGKEIAEAVARGVRAVARGDLPEFSVEYPYLAADRERWSQLRATRFAGEGPVRIVVAHLDITQRKQAERHIADTLSLNHTIIESSPIGITAYRDNGEPILTNRAMAELMGLTQEQILTQNFRELETWQRSGLRGAAMEALSTAQEQGLEVCHEPILGHRVWLMCRFVPFMHERKPHLLLLAEDVTEKKLTEAKFLRAQRMESIGSLASGIAHDLNNILAPIVMCAPLLALEHTTNSREELARMIESSAHRAVGVVKQLLGFARGKGGQKSKLQVRYLIHDITRIARETFPRTIKVEEVVGPDLWPVAADVTQLHQVLLNLCVNARDAMPSGGKLRIQAENVILDDHYASMHKEAVSGPYVRLQVEDTGTGIPDPIQEHIFESFFTTKGEEQGTGLGLTTVRGIVRDHKGIVGFRSVPGRGTTFEVHLPAVPEAEVQTEAAEARGLISRGHGELVLVVDDEPTVCDAVRRSLERQGYAVLQAHDGIDALAQFAAHRGAVRAVVTDSMMPLMDGVTLARTLRAMSVETPIIVSSGGLFGSSGESVLSAFAELGIRHILHKPHSAEALLQALGELLSSATVTGDCEETR